MSTTLVVTTKNYFDNYEVLIIISMRIGKFKPQRNKGTEEQYCYNNFQKDCPAEKLLKK